MMLKATVATALTVYGIETKLQMTGGMQNNSRALQQPLPFTVLKHNNRMRSQAECLKVATALTVYGIETYLLRSRWQSYQMQRCNSPYRLRY